MDVSTATPASNHLPLDWPMEHDCEPPLAAHLVSRRIFYTHHGLYVGGGRVIHYSGLAYGLRRGPVEEVPLEHFARGRQVCVRSGAPTVFDREQIVRRARSRLGEHRYRIFSNNCEHFCEWCLRGENFSRQVEAWRTRPRAALQAAGRAIAGLLLRSSESRPKPDRFLTTSGVAPPTLAAVPTMI